MKKTLERLAFMALGALIAGCAYFLGSTDSTANEKRTTFEEVFIKGNLLVRGAILVEESSVSPSNTILIQAKGENPVISVFHNVRTLGTSATADSSVTLTTFTKNDGNPLSVIVLKDKNGNEVYGSSIEGWQRR